MAIRSRTVLLVLQWDDNPALYAGDFAAARPDMHRNDPGTDTSYWEYLINGEYQGPRLEVVDAREIDA